MLLSEVWAAYKSDKQISGRNVGSTLSQYAMYSRLLIEHVGDIDIADVSLKVMKDYLSAHADRLKISSLSQRIKYFRSIWRWAHGEGIIATNPADKLEVPKPGKRSPKHESEESIEMMRAACESPLENAILEIFFATGCRISEIQGSNRSVI